MKLTRSEFFSKPAEYLAKAEDEGDPIELARYNDPVHAIIPFDALSDGYSAVTYYFWDAFAQIGYGESKESNGYAVTIRRFRQAKEQQGDGMGMRVELIGQNHEIVETKIANYSNKTWEPNERGVSAATDPMRHVQQAEGQA